MEELTDYPLLDNFNYWLCTSNGMREAHMAAYDEQFPGVLDDPAPMVTFEGFGASSLDFVLRAYLPNLDNRLEVIHQLHTEIDQAVVAVVDHRADPHLMQIIPFCGKQHTELKK